MRHGKTINHLSRKAGHRAALLMNLSNALIQHKRIFTTVAKAKALKKHIEPLITKSKENTTHNRRVVFAYLSSKEAVTELFSTVAGKIANRPGGYTRVIRTGFRKGDGAEMAMIELVDFNEIYSKVKGRRSEASTEKGKTRRTRRGKTKGTAPAVTAPVAKPSKTKPAASEEE
ncbi:MAG TPA: 50S ribosomal protein L17 [Saprospiraceae bacterium]|nr:50S ribosomal protein L17 [Saprospiraceae bacterium]